MTKISHVGEGGRKAPPGRKRELCMAELDEVAAAGGSPGSSVGSGGGSGAVWPPPPPRCN
jgi:hypothetical protein